MAAATAVGAVFVDRTGWPVTTVALVLVGTALVAAGSVLGRGQAASARRRSWELQAVGAAIAAMGWVAGMIPGP
jgi:hypothetical protein